MTTTSRLFSILAILGLGFIACQKNNNGTTTARPEVYLSNSNVKLGQALYATTNNTGADAVIKWSVTPATNTYLSNATGSSVILFSGAGTYVVTANFFTDSASPVPYDSSSSTVVVTDSVYSDTTNHCDNLLSIPVNTGDLVTLVPVAMSDTGGVVLLGHTRNLYAHDPRLNYTLPFSGPNGYSFYFTDIIESPCTTGNIAAPATAFLPIGSLTNGVYPLNISLNGEIYQGTLTVTDANYSFNWPYTTGIVISPTQVENKR